MAVLFRSRLDYKLIGKSCKWVASSGHNRPGFKPMHPLQKRSGSTTPFPEFPDAKTHEELYKFSVEHSETFWGTLARSRLTWSKDFTTVTDSSFESQKFGWFQGGELNASGELD